MNWFLRDPDVAQLLGLIPDFLDAEDPRPAAAQFNERYAHGGGWDPMPGLKLSGSKLIYPGDPPIAPLAFTVLPLSGEMVVLYEYDLVLIVHPCSGAWEAARMD